MLTVNLFDNSFRGDPSSTRWRTPTNFQFVRDVMKFDGPTLFVDGWSIWPTVDDVECPVKIAWLHEPPCLGEMQTVYDGIRAVAHHYERVLTYHPDLLALGAPYAPLIYGGSWIPESAWGLHPKRHLCSMLIGDKMATHGHRLRHEIYDKVKGLGVRFYGTKGVVVGYEPDTKLRVNGNHMFTIVTETCRMDNQFTEWLVDCLAVGTVPIFWGCPNVDKYFVEKGILSFETADECFDIVRSLSPGLYASMLGSIQTNLSIAKDYASPDDSWLYPMYLREYDHG